LADADSAAHVPIVVRLGDCFSGEFPHDRVSVYVTLAVPRQVKALCYGQGTAGDDGLHQQIPRLGEGVGIKMLDTRSIGNPGRFLEAAHVSDLGL